MYVQHSFCRSLLCAGLVTNMSAGDDTPAGSAASVGTDASSASLVADGKNGTARMCGTVMPSAPANEHEESSFRFDEEDWGTEEFKTVLSVRRIFVANLRPHDGLPNATAWAMLKGGYKNTAVALLSWAHHANRSELLQHILSLANCGVALFNVGPIWSHFRLFRRTRENRKSGTQDAATFNEEPSPPSFWTCEVNSILK
jgi:hypothetical protein